MKKITLSLIKVKESILLAKENPLALFENLKREAASDIANYLNSLMNVEITLFLGRKRHERSFISQSVNYRNGSYERTFAIKGLGAIKVIVPRDRQGKYTQSILPQYKRHEDEITKDALLLYLGGLSTRNIEAISEKLIGCKMSKSQVSESNKLLFEAVSKWRNRDLSGYEIHYMYVDGVNFKVRVGNAVEMIPVLVAIGVSDAGYRTVLGFQGGDKESATSWREFFKDLKSRGLQSQFVKLGIMDGLPGLESVFKEEFANAEIQRCQVHIARNVIAKVPVKFKKEASDSLRDIFYSSTKAKAIKFFEAFKEKWNNIIPSAVLCLEKNFEKSITYLKFDESLWVTLRTTNPIERINKEFKRRTRPMEIVGGEKSLYNILTFISLKMELGWRRSPIKSDGKKLRVLQEIFA